MTLSPRLIAAWQRALATEQRAYFGYGVLGPHCAGPTAALAASCSGSHDGLRLRAAAILAAAGATPVPAAADYPDLYPVTDATSAARLAVALENECASAWRYLYAVAAGAAAGIASRAAAQRALTASAVRAAQWRRLAGSARLTDPFPGLDPAS